MMEAWKDIEGYEGLYQISNLGRVYSVSNNRILKNGQWRYLSVALFKKKIRKQYLVHRLVGLHFLKGFEKDLVINHIDCNKFNNDVKNLEWVTVKENVHHAIKNNLMNIEKMRQTKIDFFMSDKCLPTKISRINKIAKISTDDVKKIRQEFKNGASLRELSNKYKSSKSNICLIVNNKTRIIA